MKKRDRERELNEEYREKRGGRVTDGLVGIREKSEWVSDGNSPETDEEEMMRRSRGKVKATESRAEETWFQTR